MHVHVCRDRDVNEAQTAAALDHAMEDERKVGVRSAVIASYEVPRALFCIFRHSPVKKLSELGSLIYYGLELGRMGRKKRITMDVDLLVQRWHDAVVGLVTAHDKDEADRQESAIEDCLTPILAAPIKQIREFYPKLMKALKDDPAVPFLVWRAYEIWIDMVISKAPDEDIKELRTTLAQEIVALVEPDVRDQLPQAMVRALQWRSADTLQKVRQVATAEIAAGNKPRLRGRESCLFIELGGTEHDPEVCVQI